MNKILELTDPFLHSLLFFLSKNQIETPLVQGSYEEHLHHTHSDNVFCKQTVEYHMDDETKSYN